VAVVGTPTFSPELFRFLAELEAHNDRGWFQSNKARYVDLAEAPMLAFIGAVGQHLKRISPRFVADPRRVGGSMFRIYRDTRFSANKLPYKTWVAARFRHRAAAEGIDVPGFYLRLSPDSSAGGGGIHHPETATLTKIRTRIVDRPRDWSAVRRRTPEILGDKLSRPPAGFDRSHPFVDDLKFKDLYVMTAFTEREVTAADFLDRYMAACRQAAPLVEFVTRAAGLKW
jgi:uncharacterized protein (TIGR02453 family)